MAELVRMVAPRLHEVSPIALTAAPGEGQVGRGSRPAMAAVGSVLGERTNRKTKLEEDHLNAWAHLKHHYVGRSTARMQRLETELQQSPQGAHRQ